MNRLLPLLLIVLLPFVTLAQQKDSTKLQLNSAEMLLESDGNLLIGGYGEVHYNQPLDKNTRSNGKLDVHRMVMLFGYRFNERTQFITELEFEHVKEVYVEQAFLQYKLNDFINLRGGLLLIPMGIINEYHEPTAFHGVERPMIDGTISPTTWREIGLGVSGNLISSSIRYQAYIVNGFNGYDGSAKLTGSGGFRKGRQKGAESYISSPNFAAKVEYYGISGLNVGLSGYFGKTQSTLYNGLDKNDAAAKAAADSSVVGISMIGVDARYNKSGLELRGQLYYTNINNADQYNAFAGSDLGSAMNGFYLEAGYNILKGVTSTKSALIPFVRYEAMDTHNKVAEGTTRNESYKKTMITGGLSWKITKGAVVKADMQWLKSDANDEYQKTFNAGVGIMF